MWSYDASLSTDKDKIRFLTGLNDTSNQRVSDEEIAGALSIADSNIYEAGAIIASSLSGKYASSQNIKIDGFSIDYSERASHFRDLAASLRNQAKLAGGFFGSAFVGGISISEMDSVKEDDDRNPSRFSMDLDSYPGTSVAETTTETEDGQ